MPRPGETGHHLPLRPQVSVRRVGSGVRDRPPPRSNGALHLPVLSQTNVFLLHKMQTTVGETRQKGGFKGYVGKALGIKQRADTGVCCCC